MYIYVIPEEVMCLDKCKQVSNAAGGSGANSSAGSAAGGGMLPCDERRRPGAAAHRTSASLGHKVQPEEPVAGHGIRVKDKTDFAPVLCHRLVNPFTLQAFSISIQQLPCLQRHIGSLE